MAHKKGFTVLEILIIVGIISILIAISVPFINNWLKENRLKSAARFIFNEFQLARLKAVSCNSDLYIYFDSVNNSFRKGLDTDKDGNIEKWITDTFILTKQYHVRFGTYVTTPINSTESIPDDGISFSNNKALFKPTPPSRTGTIFIEYDSNNPESYSSYAISVNYIGKAKIYRWNGSAWEEEPL